LIASPICLAYSNFKELPIINETLLYTLDNKILDSFRASNLSGINEQLDMFCRTYSDGNYIASSQVLHEHFLHIVYSTRKYAPYDSNDDIIATMHNCCSLTVMANVLSCYLAGLLSYQQERNDNATSEMIENVKSYIHSNYNKDISLDLIADNFHFTPSYISILFKTYSNVGFKEYLISVRIEEAKRLLKETSLKVYEIAQNSGYNDASYFVKLFKKEVGVSPNKYRRRP
jgi:two-component system response regulator YesN